MANAQKVKQERRLRKARHVRRGVRGCADKPRLSVYRSCKYIYCQAIDDVAGRTIACASELEKELREKCASLGKTEAAKVVGAALAERLKAKSIERVVFDRGWYLYHGRIKALADAARAGGLKF
ncbi:MAG: 50S ribosomal protein L18 [Planctomycetes bacterium]|nr:50S ribosomal protein L18 [Planctomycetota bacterium]